MTAVGQSRVAVVIPSWNGRELLATVLPTLAAQRFIDFETVLVDNGSSDGSVDFVQREWPDVHVLALPTNLGFAGAVNRGIAATHSEYVALVNNDIELDPDWLGELVAALDANPEAASAASKLVNFHDRSLLDGAGDQLWWSGVAHRRGYGERDAGQYETSEPVFSACAGAALYRRSAVEHVGLFDEDFFAYFEDVDWGFRAQLAGYRCRYVPSAVAYHMAGTTSRRLTGLGPYLHRRNRIALVLKNYPRERLLRHLPDLLHEEFMGFVVSVRDGHVSALLRAWRDAGRALPTTLRKRRAVQRRRIASTAELNQIILPGSPAVSGPQSWTDQPRAGPRPASATPSIGVVIVAYGDGQHLDEVAQALSRQTLAPRRVIVVDNGSGDAVASLRQKHPGIEVIQPGGNVGFAAGSNAGVLAASDCDWVALLNPDAFPEPDWLAALVEASRKHPDYCVIGSRLVLATVLDQLDGTGDVLHVSGLAWRRDHRRSVHAAGDVAGEVFSACAAAAMYRRDAFLEVGGFDESYFCYFEDTDLAFRLRLAGYRCWYEPRSIVSHVGGAATGGAHSDFTIYHSHRNLVWTYVKNMPGVLFWAYLPQHLLVNLLAICWFSMQGRAHPIFAAKRDALRGIPRAIRMRRAIHGRSRVRSRDLLPLMARGSDAYLTALSRAMSRPAEHRRPRGPILQAPASRPGSAPLSD